MTPIYYRNTNAAIIVFDVTCEESFASCDLWLKGEMRMMRLWDESIDSETRMT